MTEFACNADAGVIVSGSCHAVGMEGRAAAEMLEAMEASLARLAAFAGRGTGNAASTGADPLRDEADACLDGMAEVGSMEARLAALKVHFAAG